MHQSIRISVRHSAPRLAFLALVAIATQAAAQISTSAVKAQPVDSAKTRPVDTAKAAALYPEARRDSAVARQFKIGNRPLNRDEMKRYLAALDFKPVGKPDSSGVIFRYRDRRGASFSFESSRSEWMYAYDSVPYLSPDEYLPDTLIHTRTDGLLKAFLKERSSQYSYVNHEIVMFQERDTTLKEGAKPAVPAYYAGRYLRKLDGRYILGSAFQVRLGVGRGNAMQFLSYRDPVLTDSSIKVKVPTREMIEDYLAKWAKQPERLGKRYYPFHPDKLRIRKLKPVKVFESYVLIQEKLGGRPSRDGEYLAPRITVLAEADLVKSTKKLKVPHPATPVLLHFHFPCTPGAGLCWPDGKQGL